MKKSVLLASLILLVVGLTVGVSQAQEKSYSASRFDVNLAVEEGGSVLVTETVVFDFVGGPFTFVFREIPTDHTDGISVLETSVDDVFYPVGENPGQVEISTGNPLRLTWHLEPTSNAARTIILTYRADGVVRQASGSDELQWQSLPDRYEYFIGESRTVVGYPPTTAMISEPVVTAGKATISQSINQVSFSAQSLEPNSPLVFKLQFEPRSLITAQPNWQVEQEALAVERDAAMRATPYWIAIAILIFGAGLIPMIAYYRRSKPPAVESTMTVLEAPGNMPPAMAGWLAQGGANTNWSHAQGTMFRLAERGVLIFEELTDKKWYRSQDFAVRQVDYLPDLLAHEDALLAMMYEEKEGRSTVIKLSDLSKKISGSSWKKFREALRADMKFAAYISVSRWRVRQRFIRLGGTLLALGLLGIFGSILLEILTESLGFFRPLVVAAPVTLLGIAAIMLGSSLSIMSDGGLETAAVWRRFKVFLKDVSRGRQAVDSPTMFENYLPYAAGFGLLLQWAKHFHEEGWTETPPYFQVMPSTTGPGNMSAFVSFTAATASSGGSASGSSAGGAGAGAAGGGASGAG